MEPVYTEYSPGDVVQQVGPIGLSSLIGTQYVVGVYPDGIEISSRPDGPPLTDIHNQPRHYPPWRFRKIFGNN